MIDEQKYINIIKDSSCFPDMPLVHGFPDSPIYGTSKKITPRYLGKNESEYDKKIHLSELLPLEEYDLIIVLFSGGKDSTAVFYKLIELGVPKSKIELWHHDVVFLTSCTRYKLTRYKQYGFSNFI